MNKAIIRKIGNSSAVTLNKDVMTQLGAEDGDPVYFIPDGNGGMRMSIHDPEFEEQMKIAEKVMHDYRNALKALA